MKNILIKYLFVTLVAVTIVLYACKDDFLEPAPQGVYTEAQLTNKQGLNGALINAYATLDGNEATWYAGASNWLWGSVLGGDAYEGTEPTDQVDLNPIMRFEVQFSNPYVLNKWNGIWDGVGQANQVLRLLPKVKDMSDVEKKQVEAEARFLRGHHHFEGKKVFGNIPFIDETVTDFKVPNTDGSGNYVNIWPQIEADFKFAFDNLDEVKPHVGRANKWAAAAFLAKAYMFQNKFAEAKPLFDQIIANGKTSRGVRYQLAINYHENFRVATENNRETIFSIQASYGDGSNTNGSYDLTLAFPHSPSTPGAGCCGFFQPSQSLVNAYQTNSAGLPLLDTYNNSNVTSDENLLSSEPFTPYAGNLDPRLDWSVGRRGIPYLDWGIHPGRSWIRKVDWGGPYSPKKNVFYKADLGTLAGAVGWGWNNDALNYTIMRYADVLLMAAEAEVEVGSLAKATEYVNMIRARAAASPVKKDDGTNAANYVIGPYPTFTNKDEARKAVRFERKLELAMEGHRLFDLNRWGIAAETINGEYLSKESSRRASALGGVVFQKGKHEYLPIPEFAITQSMKDGKATLKQNPGY
ncbi:RagB/SusD family nutrient uptake outer membrane protein [Chitinophagaceae bacterium LB-8]|uniref:RagB/SusD family nutrient uptake outer membrane protein n=1 Tax=Paraflavisolibacter caeni TaxID=2982496 RepID=A0A9X3BEX7_9BACT|nr:RagB/SusD family nutrient uptake outer membrane protein [Paraflavisolibacter caeni]MCU7547914.1 RagB/SusD family nutrient uptake outer membrane protein [Paraflavisolibacter caeni]